ncbi:unnamed protein product, partial [Cyprideis torosa]
PRVVQARENTVASSQPAPAASSAPPAAPTTAKSSPPAKPMAGTCLLAPMPGMIVNYLKNPGDKVEKGEVIVVLEAMKMENSLTAPCDGTIKENPFKSGDSVAKGAALSIID